MAFYDKRLKPSSDSCPENMHLETSYSG